MQIIRPSMYQSVFSILVDMPTVRDLVRIAAADECVKTLRMERDDILTEIAGPRITVDLTYDVSDAGAEEIANAWLAASASLPEVVL